MRRRVARPSRCAAALAEARPRRVATSLVIATVLTPPSGCRTDLLAPTILSVAYAIVPYALDSLLPRRINRVDVLLCEPSTRSSSRINLKTPHRRRAYQPTLLLAHQMSPARTASRCPMRHALRRAPGTGVIAIVSLFATAIL